MSAAVVRKSARSRLWPPIVVGTGVLALLLVSWLVIRVSVINRADRIVMVHGSSTFPSATAAEWVTYANHVLVVSPTSDVLEEPTDTEIARGEGIRVRTTSLKVDEVLWSRRTAAIAAPKSIKWTTIGTSFKDGNLERQIPMTIAGQPRIELGHTYIAAVAYINERCSENDPRVPASWIPLGPPAVLPYDSKIIGQGEYEGRLVTPADMRRPEVGVSALTTSLLGSSSGALKGVLAAAKSQEYKQIFRDKVEGSPCE